jgi:hypothetical protein
VPTRHTLLNVTQPDDEAWRQIVDNYGERPTPPVEPPVEAPEPFYLELYDEEFVPPPLPPPAVISPERRLAWVGLVGSPLALVVVNLIGYPLPDVLTGALVLAFIVSFGYLVATMDPRDPDDDGARV